ncbi:MULTISPECIES: serine hydrolase domain-containing protein [unclassified Sphingobacterium]|uniref:serine hydrolase domain-containing protein n=1 Tax=unclassified Sphingobacterium TaxID=2609468 RepID=UPI0029544538|nr:serine hydrolase domain-containing protein [Sphingobacterium sp. UGAL515B_05]WON93183.1 beta-lactamase family protein [Sphingobacterium sp. UGAL515B_05]
MKKIVLLNSLFIPLIGFGQLQTVFKHKVDSIYDKNKDAIGIIVHVEAPKKNISWSYAKGITNKSTNKTLEHQQPVLIASNTKPYVAAAILRLVEKGEFTLDQPIVSLLSKKTRHLFENDGYNLEIITIKHLLSHTSGIQDYVDEDYFEFVNQHPKYKWKKEEQIKRSIDIGSLQPVGEKFSYADINYLLLTEIIEQRTNLPFYAAVRQLLRFKELNLTRTWFINLENDPENTLPLAHQYADKYNWDSYTIDPSWDLYGGGGIASTAKETALFFQYVFDGKIIQDKQLLEAMHTYVLPPDKSKYCLGIYHFDLGFNAYYHGGWWGTDVIYSPESDATIAVFTLQKEFQHLINPFIGKEFQKLLIAE